MWLCDDKTLVIGLDGEMSAADLADGGVLIQAGVAHVDRDGLTHVRSDIIGWDQMHWDERAAQVHQLPRELIEAGPRADTVDADLAAWLQRFGGQLGRRQILSVGFNVGAFDHPFFRHALPDTMSMISRRVIDLNGLCFLLDGWDDGSGRRGWTAWKRAIKANGIARARAAGVTGSEHDAGFDAAIAVHGFMWVRDLVQSATVPSARRTVAPGQNPQLVAVFGAGLLRRLATVPEHELRQLAAAAHATGVNLPTWMGRRHPALDGRTGLDVTLSDMPAALAALTAGAL